MTIEAIGRAYASKNLGSWKKDPTFSNICVSDDRLCRKMGDELIPIGFDRLAAQVTLATKNLKVTRQRVLAMEAAYYDRFIEELHSYGDDV